MASTLAEWKNQRIAIVTGDGRFIVGVLVGHDQVQNLVLNEAFERIYSSDNDVEEVPLGLFVVRGDNLCLVGDVGDLSNDVRVPFDLPPIRQQQI